MKTLVFGTINPAKVSQIRDALRPVDIDVVGLPEEARSVGVVEDGKTAAQNARKKALAYAAALGQPVLSMDNALFFDGLRPEEQPGIHVRRIGGSSKRPTDAELLSHYAALIARLGERVSGHWEFALCYGRPDGTVEQAIIISPRIFVAKPSNTLMPGYPLESLQIDPVSDKYISEMSDEEKAEFWQRAIGSPLAAFIASIKE